MIKKRVFLYVEGFNLYHGLHNLKKPRLKWLNLRSLAEKFIGPQKETFEKIYYFSSVATFMGKEIVQRHKTYIEALEQFINSNERSNLLVEKLVESVQNCCGLAISGEFIQQKSMGM
jgi:hypothetical protein